MRETQANEEDEAIIKVLDHGFVRLVDMMGDDRAIADAARVSYGQGTKKISEDRGLIRYLMRHRHTSPFEMCEIKLHIKCPLIIARQWLRHRTANVNEISGRYSVIKDEFYLPGLGEWRTQSKDNKQGSDGTFKFDTDAVDEFDEAYVRSYKAYQWAVDNGVAREQARLSLPQSVYTEFYWKIDLHNLLHFLKLRMDSHAQQEIRDYAAAIAEFVMDWVPLTWDAFTDYQLEALTLTRLDVAIIRAMVNGDTLHQAMDMADHYGWLQRSNRERREFEAKMERLGIAVPWQEANLH